MSDSATAEIIALLTAGKSLDKAVPGRVNGRVDLRGFVLPSVSFSTLKGSVAETLQGNIVLRGVRLSAVDFSNAKLDHFRFFDCEVQDCVFDMAQCRDWRSWGTRFLQCGFRAADLRDSALGGSSQGRRNYFEGVDFSSADMRGTTHGSAPMIDCRFNNARLKGVDFQGTAFERCVFEGRLSDVIFSKHSADPGGFPPNEMKDVDFAGCVFSYVDFRGLDLDSVVWPRAPGHFVISSYREALSRTAALLSAQPEPEAKRLAQMLLFYLQRAGDHQHRGIIVEDEIVDLGGKDIGAIAIRSLTTPEPSAGG